MVDLESVWTDQDKALLRGLIGRHALYTASPRAIALLDDWDAHLPLFVKVVPIEYREVLQRMKQREQRDTETVSATEEVYHG
jgi:glutamate synthase domain-containing protein 3